MISDQHKKVRMFFFSKKRTASLQQEKDLFHWIAVNMPEFRAMLPKIFL
jgi:hypothetical protein